jgi:hypothetical protein
VEPERGPDHGPLTVPAGALRLARIGRTGAIRVGWTGNEPGRVVATITARQARTIGLRAPAGTAPVVLGRGHSVPGAASFAITLSRPARDALMRAGASLRVRLLVSVGDATSAHIVTVRR